MPTPRTNTPESESKPEEEESRIRQVVIKMFEGGELKPPPTPPGETEKPLSYRQLEEAMSQKVEAAVRELRTIMEPKTEEKGAKTEPETEEKGAKEKGAKTETPPEKPSWRHRLWGAS